MKTGTNSVLRISGGIFLFLLSCASFYYSLFWGWASRAGAVEQPRLKLASNVALGISFVLFWSAVGLWLLPHFLKKKERQRGNVVPLLDRNAVDPWTYFGSFSRAEVDDAAARLREGGLTYEIREAKEEKEVDPADGWTGPFALWIRDEHAGLAESLLVPLFSTTKKRRLSSRPAEG